MCRIVKNTAAVLMLLFAGIATAGQGIWQDVTPAQLQAKSLNSKMHQYSADHVALRNALSLVPREASGDFSQQIDLPMPDGSLANFVIVESPVMKPALAARYPEIKTFKVYGIDDPMASGRVDITPQGFHAMLFTAKGRLFIEPANTSTQASQYLSRYRSGQPAQEFSCETHKLDFEDEADLIVSARSAARTPGSLLEYDLAVAATSEYVVALGGSVAEAQAGIVTAINRINLIYERDLGIRLMLVGSNDQLIESGGNVNFSNNNTFALLEENQDWIDSKIGSAAYDVGHVFSTGGGGAAFLGSACDDPIKAKGTSGQSFQLEQDSFYIDYVAHEIGHQFNAEHSFNGTTSSCDSGRNSASAFEPGSGSTIMAYAGICLQENLQIHSDATFHAGSIAEIDSFTRNAGNCYAIPTAPTNNNDPTIAPIANRVIPANTPFILDGIAADIDPMPALTYQWDQMDAGCPTDFASFGTDNGSNALFRSYLPRDETWRNFPALGTQVRGRFDKAEVLPCNNRDLDFRLTARDGRSGQDIEDVRISVDNSTGPFKITSLNPPPPTPIIAGMPFAVNWDVANTHLPPVNCTNVDFDLISFSVGYTSYSIYSLDAASNLNDGSEFVTLDPITANPRSTPHSRSRVRVKCSDNIFYDLSDTDLTIEGNMMFPDVNLDDTAFTAYSFVTRAIAMATVAPACGVPVDCSTPPPAVESGGKSGGGSGSLDYFWLMLMSGIIAMAKLYRRYGLQ
jgi:hypothetical protein